jgi:hypothetical protein
MVHERYRRMTAYRCTDNNILTRSLQRFTVNISIHSNIANLDATPRVVFGSNYVRKPMDTERKQTISTKEIETQSQIPKLTQHQNCSVRSGTYRHTIDCLRTPMLPKTDGAEQYFHMLSAPPPPASFPLHYLSRCSQQSWHLRLGAPCSCGMFAQ